MKTDKMVWTGRAMTILAILPFCLGAFMKLSGNPQMAQGWTHLGWPEPMIRTIAILEISCVALYLIPRVSVLGAILLTGFLGGAIATHLRLGEGVVVQVVLGVMIWGGLYLREPRLRAILPIRRELNVRGENALLE